MLCISILWPINRFKQAFAKVTAVPVGKAGDGVDRPIFSAGNEIDPGWHYLSEQIENARNAQRQRRFDLARYDRMSVLTRELRSLVTEALAVELRIARRRSLDRAALARALDWV